MAGPGPTLTLTPGSEAPAAAFSSHPCPGSLCLPSGLGQEGPWGPAPGRAPPTSTRPCTPHHQHPAVPPPPPAPGRAPPPAPGRAPPTSTRLCLFQVRPQSILNTSSWRTTGMRLGDRPEAVQLVPHRRKQPSTVHLTIRRHRREAPLQRKRGREAVPPHGSSPSRRPFPPAQDTAANSISGGRKHTHM